MISMPERPDKRDARYVLAELSGFNFTYMPGVHGEDVSPKALPYTFNQLPNAVGCWRAHMDVLQHIVKNKISSALILEDDVDWDVSLKKQLAQFSEGTRYILDTSLSEESSPDAQFTQPYSPYGDGWDLMWLGHCGSDLHPSDPRLWVIPYDPTAAPEESLWNLNRPDMSAYGRQARLVFRTYKGWCTAGYAVTLRGAEKALYHLSMLPNNAPVDVGYLVTCSNEEANFTCLSSHPSILGYYRDAGSMSKDSDINQLDEQIRESGTSLNLVFSAHDNVENLFSESKYFKSSFPELTGEEMSIDEISQAVGHPELRPLELAVWK